MDRREVMDFIFRYLQVKNTFSYGQFCSDFEREHHVKLWDNPLENQIRECIQSLLNLNILMPWRGVSYHQVQDKGDVSVWQLSWNQLQVTDYGRKCIEEQNILPFDPEGYLDEIRAKIPNLGIIDPDDVILTYLSESITTYNRNCLLSSAITLGAASEKMMLLLIDMFTDKIADTSKKADFEKKTQKSSIYQKYKAFTEKFLSQNVQSALPAHLKKDVEIYLDGIFNFIRINRNKTGHPTGIVMSKKTMYANLQIFADYAKRIFDLIEFFEHNLVHL